MENNIKFKTFALITMQSAVKDLRDMISEHKQVLDIYKKVAAKIYKMDEDQVQKHFEADHPIHEEYRKYIESENAAIQEVFKDNPDLKKEYEEAHANK